MDDLPKPAEQISGFEQRADKDNRDPNITLASRQAQDQLPLRPKAWERWKSGKRSQQDAEQEGRSRLSGKHGPIQQALSADMAPQPEQPDLGEQMIDEQAYDHEVQHGAFGLQLLQQTDGQCHKTHLADRGVAEQPLRLGLLQTDQV